MVGGFGRVYVIDVSDPANPVELGKTNVISTSIYRMDYHDGYVYIARRSKGMEIVDPENDEAEFISLATTKVWPSYYESIGGVDKLNAVLTALGRDPVK